MPKGIYKLKTYPNFATLLTHSIFNEPYKTTGTVYYFNNNVVIIKYRTDHQSYRYKGKNITCYSVKVVSKGEMIIYTSNLTKEQIESIYKLILPL